MNKVFIFTLGAAVGSLVTWKIVETKYKKIADEEIESVVERFKERERSSIKINPDGIELKYDDKPVLKIADEPVQCADIKIEDKATYEQLVREVYNNDEVIDDDGFVIETPPAKEYIPPYVISPEEYDEFGNITASLTYYADGVLVDEENDIIADPESLIGDALNHFGEYEDDAVHVRDENIECDYEILKSEKTFSEAYKEEN